MKKLQINIGNDYKWIDYKQWKAFKHFMNTGQIMEEDLDLKLRNKLNEFYEKHPNLEEFAVVLSRKYDDYLKSLSASHFDLSQEGWSNGDMTLYVGLNGYNHCMFFTESEDTDTVIIYGR